MPRVGYFQITDTSSGITLVQYHDNNHIVVASNKCVVVPMGITKRWSNKEKETNQHSTAILRRVIQQLNGWGRPPRPYVCYV